MDQQLVDRLAIRQLIETWALARDQGQWEKFKTTFHPDSEMVATWFAGPFDAFLEATKAGFEKGVKISHFLGGTILEIQGDRCYAQTRMKILQRAIVDGVEVDVTCYGYFHDWIERRAGEWKIFRRRVIYERDRLDPLDPLARITFDRSVLDRMPEGYRYLGYVQVKSGMQVDTTLPTFRAPSAEPYYAASRAWLAGR